MERPKRSLLTLELRLRTGHRRLVALKRRPSNFQDLDHPPTIHSRYVNNAQIHVVLLMSCWQKSIRELGQALLGLESPKDMPQPVSQKEIDAWDTNCGPCCTVENFHIDLVGYTRSGWNKSAAQVFAMEYLKRHKGENYTLEFVVEAWLTRVAGMKAQYRRLQHDESTLKKYKVLHRRHQWKGEVRHKLLVFALLTCSSCTNAASTLLASTMISESKPFI